jgi:hypothetical protein
VGVALVAHVEENRVRRGIEDPVQGYGQFNHPQVAREVAAVFAYDPDDFLSDFPGKPGQLLWGQFFYVIR